MALAGSARPSWGLVPRPHHFAIIKETVTVLVKCQGATALDIAVA